VIRQLQTDCGHFDFSEAAVHKSNAKREPKPPSLFAALPVYQADNFCFLRRATKPSIPRPASIMA